MFQRNQKVKKHGMSEHSVAFVSARVLQLDSCDEDSLQDSLLLHSVYPPVQVECGFDTLLEVLHKQKALENPMAVSSASTLPRPR